MRMNSATIIYFSPTGATKKIIHAIIKGMDIGVQQEIDLTSPKVRNEVPPSIDGELVIIGVPVYGLTIPKIVESFFAKLRGNNKPAVVIAVYGNMSAGIALNELYTVTENLGFKVIGAGLFLGEHTFSTEETPVAQSRPNLEDLNKAEELGRNIMKRVSKLDHLDDISIKIPQRKLNRLWRAAISLRGALFPRSSATKIFSKIPKADPKVCNRCGVCSNLCPMGAIDRDTLAIDEEQCLRCFSCVKRCPVKARQIVYRPKVLVSKVLTAKSRVKKEPQTYYE